MDSTIAETRIEHVDFRSTQCETVEGKNNHNNENDISYYRLVASNREYRIFIISYIITNLGQWLTYVATIDFIENDLSKTGRTSRTAISMLVLLSDLPNVFLSLFGGTLADAHDRRKVMVILNIAGAICSLLFVAAYQTESIVLIYSATFLQQCIAGMYQPSSSSIIPMLVTRGEELKKATTLEGLCWSGMSAFGAVASGIVVDAFGGRACFCRLKKLFDRCHYSNNH
jgi:DHA3 family macrolide efflux protein-like MFS transporter